MANRKAEKEQRRAERLQREEAERKASVQRRLYGVIGGAVIAAAVIVAVVVITGNNGSSRNDNDSSGPGPTHVHGLGIDESDGALFIATHTGLFRVEKDEKKATRVGESQQDIMGFSIVTPDRFIGSGHPAPEGTSQPPLLGLIESSDGGNTWQSVSLSGEADFHVLRSADKQIYGFDSTQGRLMVSTDAGENWTEQTPPGPLLDLVIDPANPSHVIATSEDGLHESTDRGKTWRTVNGDLIGLLAWPTRKTMYLVDQSGQVQRSSDSGRTWKPAGSIGDQAGAFIAHKQDLYAALHDGTIKHSSDQGRTWTVRSTP